jgi:hypothetical protein
MRYYTENISIMGTPLPPSKDENEWTLSNPEYNMDNDTDLLKLAVHLEQLAELGL